MTQSSRPRRILYCRCAYAKVVPIETKDQVLRDLCESGVAFDAVPDLCEMSARSDPTLKDLADTSDHDLVIAACYPRAVKWLFHAADAKLPDSGVEVLNMRTEDPQAVSLQLLGGTGQMPVSQESDARESGATEAAAPKEVF